MYPGKDWLRKTVKAKDYDHTSILLVLIVIVSGCFELVRVSRQEQSAQNNVYFALDGRTHLSLHHHSCVLATECLASLCFSICVSSGEISRMHFKRGM